MKKVDTEQPAGDGKPNNKNSQQRLYTSQNEDLPTQLSYHNVKLANFIELQLTDLMDSIQQISGVNYQNQLKECLSRSYNAFHEMQKIFADLGMGFLYQQTKKLISCYGIIFVFLSEKLQKSSSKQQQSKIQQTLMPSKIDAFEKQIKQNIENMKMWKSQKQIKQYKRLKGVHLYNQSYARCVDYNIQQFRQLREKQNERQITEQQKQHMRKLEEQKKLRQAIFQQEQEYNANLTVDGQDVAMFIHRQRKFKEVCKNMSLGDQLEKIAVFFKQSHNQALEFLRKEKHLQTFLQLTEGFNTVMQDYQQIKEGQLFLMRDKVKQLFELMRIQNVSLHLVIKEKQKQIQALKQAIQNKKTMVQSVETQTYYNFDEEIKQLLKRSVESEMMNAQLKAYISKIAEQSKKERSSFLVQITQKQSNNKQLKDIVEDKLNYIAKVERKLKIIVEGNKNKGAKDPIQYFNSLTPEMKKLFCEQLKEQGFLQSKELVVRKSGNKATYKPTELNHLHPGSGDRTATRSSEQEATITAIKQPKKRQSNLVRKSNFGGKPLDFANQDSNRAQVNVCLIIPQADYALDETSQQWEKSTKNAYFENSLKSKKMISIRNINEEDPTKQLRKVDKDKSVYSNSSNSLSMGSNIKFENYAFADTKDMKLNFNNKLNQIENKNESKGSNSFNANGGDTQKVKKKQIPTISQVNRQSAATQKINEESQSNAESPRIYLNTVKQKNKMQQINSVAQLTKQQIYISSNTPNECSCKHLSHQQRQRNQNNIERHRNKQGRVSCQMNLYSETHKSNARIKTQGNSNEKLSPNYRQFQLSNQFNIVFHNCVESYSHLNVTQKLAMNSTKYNSIDSAHYQVDFKNKCSSTMKNNQNYPQFDREGTKEQQNIKYHQQQDKQKFNENISEKQKQKNRESAKNTKKSKNKEHESLSMIKKQIIGQLRNKIQVSKNEQSRRKINNVKNHSLDNSFHRSFNSNQNQNNIISSLMKKELNNSLSQTYANFKGVGNQQNKQNTQLNNLQKYFSKTNHNMSKESQQYQMKMALQEELGSQQLILASRQSNTVQQFKQKAMKVHEKKCGRNCKHLQRYIQIFMKLRNLDGKSKREIIKLHIQNMNDKLGSYNEMEVNLPYIKRN